MRSTALQMKIALLMVGAIACNDPGQPQDPSPGIVPVQGVRVTPQSVQLLGIGDTRQLLATVSPANATDQALIWESSDSSIVTVDTGGTVTAKAAGSGVFITAYTHDGHFQSTANVGVNP